MSDSASLPLDVEIVATYPRAVELGKRYEMTVDLITKGMFAWPYEQEEYPVYCVVNGEPAFEIETVGKPVVVVHRFGGTYGPARFVLNVVSAEPDASLRLSLVNAAGLPLRTLELEPVRISAPQQGLAVMPVVLIAEIHLRRGRFHVTLWVPELEEKSKTITFLQELTPGGVPPEDPREVGELIFELLLKPGKNFPLWRRTQHHAQSQGRPVRLQIEANDPHVLGLPFQHLFDPERRYFILDQTSPPVRIVRVYGKASDRLELPRRRPRLLIVVGPLELAPPSSHDAVFDIVVKDRLLVLRELTKDYEVYLYSPRGNVRFDELSPDELMIMKGLEPYLQADYFWAGRNRESTYDVIHVLTWGLPSEGGTGALSRYLKNVRFAPTKRDGRLQLFFIQIFTHEPVRQRPLAAEFALTLLRDPTPVRAVVTSVNDWSFPTDTLLFYKELAHGIPLDEALQDVPAPSSATPGIFLSHGALDAWIRPGALEGSELTAAKLRARDMERPQAPPRRLLPQELIVAKRNGQILSGDDIRAFVRGYTRGEVPEYQMSAMCMAIFFRGLDLSEQAAWTWALLESGNTLFLPEVSGTKVGVHTVDGVGGDVSVSLAPLVAACGVPVPIVADRLGYRRGRLDPLEAIPGFQTLISVEGHQRLLHDAGASFMRLLETNLAPTAMRLQALREMTVTEDSFPLIAASIMSQKMAEGIDALVLDLKVGSGSLLKTLTGARELAHSMINLAAEMGYMEVVAVLSSMEEPLGRVVGSSLELMQAIDLLRGVGPKDFVEVTLALAAPMLVLGGKARNTEEARKVLARAIYDGSALRKLGEIIAAQNGDPGIIEDYEGLPQARGTHDVRARVGGFVTRIDTAALERAAVTLGARRQQADSTIDPSVGFTLLRKLDEPVRPGEPIVRIHYNDESRLQEVAELLLAAWSIGPQRTMLASGFIEYVT